VSQIRRSYNTVGSLRVREFSAFPSAYLWIFDIFVKLLCHLLGSRLISFNEISLGYETTVNIFYACMLLLVQVLVDAG
jgi:hypothetical protein